MEEFQGEVEMHGQLEKMEKCGGILWVAQFGLLPEYQQAHFLDTVCMLLICHGFAEIN